jgi:hypothetical protein
MYLFHLTIYKTALPGRSESYYEHAAPEQTGINQRAWHCYKAPRAEKRTS